MTEPQDPSAPKKDDRSADSNAERRTAAGHPSLGRALLLFAGVVVMMLLAVGLWYLQQINS